MERLQRVQQQAKSAETTPHRNKNGGEFAIPELPSLDGTPRSRGHITLEGLSMDLFDDLATDDPSLYNFLSPRGSSGADWTQWIPTDLPSPSEVNIRNSRPFSSSSHDDCEEIMNAILSDADAQQADLRESAFDPLIFGESSGSQESRYCTADNQNSSSSDFVDKDEPGHSHAQASNTPTATE